jgi:hypothetical protein
VGPPAAGAVLLLALAAPSLPGGGPGTDHRARGPQPPAVARRTVSDSQAVLDHAVVTRFPSAMLLFDVGVEAALRLTMLAAPVVVTGAAPTPTSPYIVAMHDAAQPALPPLAVGDRVALVGTGSMVPRRVVRGVVVARRHYMFTRSRGRRTQADGVWEYGWAYLIKVPLNDRNPNSRFEGWLRGFTVTRDVVPTTGG